MTWYGFSLGYLELKGLQNIFITYMNLSLVSVQWKWLQYTILIFELNYVADGTTERNQANISDNLACPEAAGHSGNIFHE